MSFSNCFEFFILPQTFKIFIRFCMLLQPGIDFKSFSQDLPAHWPCLLSGHKCSPGYTLQKNSRSKIYTLIGCHESLFMLSGLNQCCGFHPPYISSSGIQGRVLSQKLPQLPGIFSSHASADLLISSYLPNRVGW